jgi:hypothetical protein
MLDFKVRRLSFQRNGELMVSRLVAGLSSVLKDGARACNFYTAMTLLNVRTYFATVLVYDLEH